MDRRVVRRRAAEPRRLDAGPVGELQAAAGTPDVAEIRSRIPRGAPPLEGTERSGERRRAVGGQRRERWERERAQLVQDRKSTRLNSSHSQISYAVFCLKKTKM